MSATTEMGTTTTTTCPRCGEQLSVDERFVTWCEACEWNLDATPSVAPVAARSGRLRADTDARALYAEICRSGTEPARTQVFAVNAVALLMHVLTLAMLLPAAALLADGFGLLTPLRFAIGAVLALVGLYVQPFLHDRNRRKWAQPLTRDMAPILFGLIDDVAHELGATSIDSVYFNTRYSGSILRRRGTGWTLTLGLQLWSVLTPEERVALIAHELGHQINRDQRRSRLVQRATVTARRWEALLNPRPTVTPNRALKLLLEKLAVIATLPYALIAAGLGRTLGRLAARQGQAAEYHADQLSVRAAGTEAAQGLLEKLALAAECERELNRAVRFRHPLSPWDELTTFVAGIPATERERLRRVGRLTLAAVDPHHPPTQLRADRVAAQPFERAAIRLDGGRLDAVDREIEGIKEDATVIMRSVFQR